jgi:alpha-tubulin suppressor-like RCC1 family protein
MILKIEKLRCGPFYSLLLSCDRDIYAFGSNGRGQVGNGTIIIQKFPIKLEINNKFISHHILAMRFQCLDQLMGLVIF